METENTELNGFHFFLLNYDAEDRMQIRRQMKALLSEIRVQGDILKNLSVTLALGGGRGKSPGDRQFLEKCQTPHRGRLLAGTGKLMEGKIESGESLRGQVRSSRNLMTGSPTRSRVWIPLQCGKN